MNKITKNEITAVILAGGQASRMDGKDKGWAKDQGHLNETNHFIFIKEILKIVNG